MGAYNNLSTRLSNQIEARFKEIEAIYNFDSGHEVEVAICQLLTQILPDKYGVCRGFIISSNGNLTGDDIIIYDKLSFPLIRQHSISDFSLKQQVPVEAVYAYIECKNSIVDQETLDKAIDQVTKVKKHLLTRYLESNPKYEVEGPIYNGRARDWPRQEPEHVNQPFTVILTRKWDNNLLMSFPELTFSPDLMILGPDHLASLSPNLGPDGIKGAVFYDSKFLAPLNKEKVDNNAYGIGMLILFQALSMIHLLPINWFETLNEELSPFK